MGVYRRHAYSLIVCHNLPPLPHIQPTPVLSVAHLFDLPHSQVVEATFSQVENVLVKVLILKYDYSQA